jgi:hypothetical protein
MYHPYNKNSSHLRNALYKEYNGKCVYCGLKIQPRHMHVDHILPTKIKNIDDAVAQYILELKKEGFIQDSIENYLPACSSCNREKSNKIYKVTNLIHLHEEARGHLNNILRCIEKEQRNEESFYEPIDEIIWRQLDFKYQRDISHAIMGYRLTSADVKSCPNFPPVERTIKRLNIVDYAMILGETGCGKSISLFQIAHHFFVNGWQVYLLNDNIDLKSIELPDNTEKSIYLIDDAQIYSEHLVNNLCEQSRSNRKVLLAKTITDQTSPEDIILTNSDAINTLYKFFYEKREEILPIVSLCDKRVGINMDDISIEQRLESARTAKTPWQFTYILRGGWNTIKALYSSIHKTNSCDLLVATIAVFQILNLDKSVELNYLNEIYRSNKLNYHWSDEDIAYLVKKWIIISLEDIRIVHLESANIIVSLFFDCDKTDEQSALIKVIENEFQNRIISPLGLVWLCNGCRSIYKYYSSSEQLFITDSIKDSVNVQIKDLIISEDVRNMSFLLDKVFLADRTGKSGIQIYKDNESKIIDLINNADSISAWGLSVLLNTLYNHDKSLYFSLSQRINWNALMDRMMKENTPDYYSWGKLFNRGLSLLGKKKYTEYSDLMFSVMKWAITKATVNNIEQISFFLCSVSFLNNERIHDLMPNLSKVYEAYFEKNMEQAIHIFDFNFIFYMCGIGILRKFTPSEGQRRTARMIINAFNEDVLASTIARSYMSEWYSIKDVLLLIYSYDVNKYIRIIQKLNLSDLSERTKNSWGNRYEICMIIDYLQTADEKIAISFLDMNQTRIECYYSTMVAIDACGAIKANQEKGIPIELFTEHWWDASLAALKALYKTSKSFTFDYLGKNANSIADRYTQVTALDFEKRDSLDLLLFIGEINRNAYVQITQQIDKDQVMESWDKCGGLDPRRKRWVKQRKEQFINMISSQQ